MINAVSISTRVEKIIDDKTVEGFIHSVFDQACNIQLADNNLIGLISSKYGDNPYSISLDLAAGQTMKSLSLQQGMKVIINRERIRSVVGAFHINLQNTISWDPSLVTDFQHRLGKAQLKNNLRIVLRVLIEQGNFYGIGPLVFEYPEVIKFYNYQELGKDFSGNHYSEFIAPRIKELMYGIVKKKNP
jgi:hypothetical protein